MDKISLSLRDLTSLFAWAFVVSVCIASAHSQNYSLRFFGNGVNDIDRVKIPIDNPDVPCDVKTDFTLEFMLRASLNDNPLGIAATQGPNDNWTLGHVILDRDIFGNGDYGDYGVSLAGGKIAFGVNNGTDSYTLIGNTNVTDDNWHFIALTREESTTRLQIFVDGVLDASIISGVSGDISYRDNRPTSWPNDPYIVLGAEKHDYDNSLYPSFNGYLDELRISTIVRYNTNYTPAPTLTDDIHTVALYHFNEGMGTILTNSAALSLGTCNGTLHVGGNPVGPLWDLPLWHLETSSSSQKLNNDCNPIVFPTVSGGIFEIKAPCPIEDLKILDKNAKTIPYQRQNQRIDISDLPDGLYIINLLVEKTLYSQKIMKIKSLLPHP
ncbi:MAG: LamG-like jellyroll fold domain-containing protein [Bacteroidia bacterium]